ncbi:MAG: TetR/AcrR family transcriptional regulator [Acidobacteria bacterium]|nr:TetR/AcrR family transcriptional regulator [Acidobacteriota bacterium]
MSTRENILAAARELFTSRGYEATSPRDIMDRAQVGQGSLYHHFRSKRQLGAEVLQSVCDDLLGVGREQLQAHTSPQERLDGYLHADRDALAGCRLGRFAYDAALNEQELREPSRRYFLEMESLLMAVFTEMEQRAGKPEDLTACALAVIQGGYVLSRIHADAAYLRRAVEGFSALVSGRTTCGPPVQ